MSLASYYTKKNTYTKVSRGRLDGIITLLGDSADQLILDVGCGAGEVGRAIKNRSNAQVWGVDVSINAVNEARKVLDGAELCDLESGSGLPNPLSYMQFDFFVISEVLEHLFMPQALLQELAKVSDSPAIITVPNILFWKNRLKILFGSFDYTETGLMDRGHIHFFTWASLQRVINEGGYTIVGAAHHVPTRGTKFLAKYFPGLFCYQFVIKIIPKK